MPFYIGVNKFSARFHDGSSSAKAAPSLQHLAELGIRTNGFYWVNPQDAYSPIYIYVDFNYRRNEAWALVISNRINTNALNSSSYTADGSTSVGSQTYAGYTNITNNINYKGSYGNTNLDFNCFIGAKYWKQLGKNISQFVSTSARTLSDTGNHTKRYRWGFRDMSATYAFQNVYTIKDETGSGTPGFYAYHATNGFSLSTYDQDQDAYSQNCSVNYGYNPWWYGACWDGNYFAGGGYADQPNWSGAGSDLHNYGAIYIGGYI
jgi:hypothetical protein